MSKDTNQNKESAERRHRAEKKLNAPPESEDQGAPTQSQRLLHELQVHQIELEMQNEELRESRGQVEATLERYTDLYDFAPVGYFTLSANGTIREVNLPGARLLGLERSGLVGARFGVFVSDPTRYLFDSWLKNVFATESRQTCEVTLTKEGQDPMIVELEGTRSIDGMEGRTVVADITARKALEGQLRQAQKMEVVGQLAGGVAHDYNNILGAMILKLEILQLQQQLPSDARQSLNELESLAKRAANLTHQLLLFSRRQTMHPERLEINAALNHLRKVLERLFGKDIICVHVPSTRELWVDADAAMLNQAVMNLCLNAKDAMPDGGTLTLEATLAEINTESSHIQLEARPGQFVCLRISDTGCGMDAEILQHLFEPFFTTKEIGKGTGMGLASAYGIVHQHKGWMNVESTVGKGTNFRLYFPLSIKAEVAFPKTPQLSSNERNETILLVEDEAALLHISTQALTMFGYRVLTATNGQEALELWKDHWDNIDLVLTDMRMPNGISGLELAGRLRKAKPSIKIIIMSGYSMEKAQSSNASEVDYAFLAKPFDLNTLAETVRHSLD